MGALLMEHHEKWMTGKKYYTMDRYIEERDDAKKLALAQRASHLHVV